MNETLYTVDELNEWVYRPRMVRKYQLLLLTKKTILIDIDNITYKVVSCRAFKGRNQLLITTVGTNQQKILQSDLIGTGYRLKQKLIEPEPHKWPSMDQDICVVVGHPNFAHFMWNQLPGLLEIPVKMLNVYQQSCADVIDCSLIDKVNIKPRPNIHKDLTIYVGSMYISSQCKDMLHSQHDVNKSPPRKKYTISLGVRGSRVRGITNELALYRELLQHIRSEPGKFAIYIDGVTIFEDTNSHVRNVAEELEFEIIKLIESFPDLDIKSLNKIPIKEWIRLAKDIDYYVTHVGTMAHKYSFIFYDKPGTLIGHTSASFIKWTEHHTCVTAETHDIPLELYNIHSSTDVVPRNRNCDITDLQTAVQCIVRNMNNI